MWFCLSFLVSQSFLTLKVYVFYKTLENFGYYLLKYVFCQLLFSHSATIITGMLDVLLLFHTFLSFHSLFLKYFSDYFSDWIICLSSSSLTLLCHFTHSVSLLPWILYFSVLKFPIFSFIVSISAEKVYLSISFKAIYFISCT